MPVINKVLSVDVATGWHIRALQLLSGGQIFDVELDNYHKFKLHGQAEIIVCGEYGINVVGPKCHVNKQK